MESQGISFINYQLRVGIAAASVSSQSLFSTECCQTHASSLSGGRQLSGHGPLGHTEVGTEERRHCELFMYPSTSSLSKNPAVALHPCLQPSPFPLGPKNPQHHRGCSDPIKQPYLLHCVPSCPPSPPL